MLERLAAVGLIDDRAYAVEWMTSRRRRGLAPRAIAGELRRRGVDEVIIRETVDTVDPDDVLAAATALARMRCRTMVGLPEPVKVRRLAAMLARRGYSPEVVFQAIRHVLGDGVIEDGPADAGSGSVTGPGRLLGDAVIEEGATGAGDAERA